MAVTSTDEPESTAHAVLVTVRVPNEADGDLTRETERRLTRVEGIIETAVDGLRGLEPRLSATIVTVEATVRTERDVSAGELPARLSGGPGVEDVVLADA